MAYPPACHRLTPFGVQLQLADLYDRSAYARLGLSSAAPRRPLWLWTVLVSNQVDATTELSPGKLTPAE